MARSGHKASGPKIDATERQRQALELRKAGVTYDAIARQLGYASKSGAEKAVSSALRKVLQEPAEELRTLHFWRLEDWIYRLTPKIREGDPVAIRTAIRVLEREAKLYGLDAPIKFDLVKVVEEVAAELGMTPDETAATLADVTAMLAAERRVPA